MLAGMDDTNPTHDPAAAGVPPTGVTPGGAGGGVPGGGLSSVFSLGPEWDELIAQDDERIVAEVDALLGPDVDEGVRLAALWDAIAATYAHTPYEQLSGEERRLIDPAAPEGGWSDHG